MARRILFIGALGFVVAQLAGCETVRSVENYLDIDPGASSAASFELVQDRPSLDLRFHGVALKDSNVDAGSNAIALHLDSDADAQLMAQVQRRVPDWIVATHTDGGTATIVARSDVAFSTVPQPDGFDLLMTAHTTEAAAAAPPAAAPTVAVQTTSLRSEMPQAAAPVDGLQNEGLRGAFGVDDKPAPAAPGL